MNVAQIILLILDLVNRLVPLAEQLKGLAQTTTVSAEDRTAIDAQLKAAHDRLGRLIGAS